MNRRARQIIAGFFIAGFFIIGPLTVYYARGYRYSWTTQQASPTGTLIVSTEPSRAAISLNETLVSSRTPATITSLPPRRYEVTLSKEGYHSWQKSLFVNRDEATFVSDVRLLRNTLPTVVQTGDYTLLSKSPTGEQVLLGKKLETSDVELSLFDMNTQALYPLPIEFSALPEITTWSHDGRFIASLTGRSLTIVDATTRGFVRLSLPVPKQAYRLGWDQAARGMLVLFDGQQYLHATAENGWQPTVASATQSAGTVEEFWYQSSRRFELVRTADAYTLRTTDINGATSEIPLDSEARFTYQGGWGDYLLLQNTNRELLIYRYANSGLLRVLTASDVQALSVREAQGIIAYATSFELWLFTPDNAQRTLLTRLGTPIQNLALLPDSSHVLYSTENRLWAVELDGRDVRNQWELARLTSLTTFFVSSRATQVHLIGQLGSLTGLFSLEI